MKMCLCPEAFNVHLILHVDYFDKLSMLSKSKCEILILYEILNIIYFKLTT